jgi:four helix bundle suffix protein
MVCWNVLNIKFCWTLLSHQADFLLDHQITALERNLVEQGGYSEQLAAARLAVQGRKKNQ